ncbi:oleate hydratase [Paenibacillus sp. P3E]|uniref:oleate hydratase n=1 Tax=unclassified Paenibacillus TaxID=185978 RepID=UPI00093CF458|nr:MULTISPECIES: oleate hydratase [unclassified Paenibacillus]OKP76020.1 oleate hydratase [Paenibacillus sp. P3E]OKP84361.1 oleate hydratase [Paenibacillus sp. P32E]
MGTYQRINPLVQGGIASKKAYLVGGGIGSLSAAAFLIRDGHMPGRNIHILEQSAVYGGSMDGAGNAKDGYSARGGREIEEHFECFMELFGFIPSLTNPDRTVLEEFRELNLAEPIESHCRLVEKAGQKADFSSLGLSTAHALQLGKLVMVTEEKLGAVTIEQFFDPSFLDTNFWYFWRSMFAFENWHSVVEVKRYMERFMHLISGMNQLKGILHTEYNQFDSLILPLMKWLESEGVHFDKGHQVTDLDVDFTGGEKTVTAIHVLVNGMPKTISTSRSDLVMVTNGSMTENSTLGDMDHPAVLNRSVTERGCWSLWEKLAAKSPDFGHPEVFCGDIDKTKWLSFTMTFTDDEIVFPYLLELTGDLPGMGGVVTIKDSNWMMSWTAPKQPHFINQPENVKVLWAYGLFPDAEGNYIKKKMSDCTGRELLEELCYHIGLKDRIPEILEHTTNVIPCMMPYITSQFMPRVAGDRPQVVPQGSTNLAFLGQFAEVPDDCVFTVEYSVRSAMMAVYSLLALEKEVIPVHPSKFDVRVLLTAVRTCLGNKPLPLDRTLGQLLSGTVISKLL